MAPQPVLKGFQARRQNHGIWEAIPITNFYKYQITKKRLTTFSKKTIEQIDSM